MDPIFQFGRFEVRPALRQVRVDGSNAPLGARAFDLLLALIERRGRLVTKNELLDVVWPGLVVEENNLTVQISTLRKLLGADAIATIPGRGYRFTAAPLSEPSADPSAHLEPPATPALRTNLPELLAPLIGRDDDLAALGTLMGEHRLITITGAGGMGKTRLAERLLHDRRTAYTHGVAWVELAGLADAALLPSTIAGAIGLQMASSDPLQGLIAALKPLQMLVALDNAEYLLDATAQLVQAMLDAAPHVRFIVTSQAPLHLALECVYRLDGLAVPEIATPLDEAVRFGAVALFIERARAADRRFVANAQTLPGIIAICAQLDGVALAIELAAARLPVLGATALAASLGERLRLLTQGRRSAPERQRTLRAALEWSHGLLNPDEATVFRRLGVFVGGFSLEMARQVAAGDEPVDEWAVVDALGALVDRSLVAADTAETPRYRLLESARALAIERLAAAGEDAGVRQRHVQAVMRRFVAVAAACADGLVGVDPAIAMLEPDLDNARAAMAWSLKTGDKLSAVTLAPALSFALTSSRREEYSRLWEATAECVDAALPADVTAAWAVSHGQHLFNHQPTLATALARQVIAHCREHDDRRGLYVALGLLGVSTARQLELADSAKAVEEMRALEAPTWPARLRVRRALAAGVLEGRRGDLDAARDEFRQAHALAVAAADGRLALGMLGTLADLDLASGRIDDAVHNGLELERQLRSSRHQCTLAQARVNLTGALLAQGSLAAARQMASAAEALALRFDLSKELADNLALLAALEQRPEASLRLIAYADACYAAFRVAREVTERGIVDRVERLLREQLGDAEFERLRRGPAVLRDEEVLAVGLGGADGSS